MRTKSFVTALHFMIAIGVLAAGRAACAGIGQGTLIVEDAPYDYGGDFFALQIGVPYVVLIEGVLADEVGGSPIPEAIPVWVKSPFFGNTMHTATRRSGLSTYSFTYTPPATSEGGEFGACSSATVSYGNGPEGAYDARSLCFGPGWWCLSYPWVGVIQFVSASGAVIPCPPTGVEHAAWSSVKQIYR